MKRIASTDEAASLRIHCPVEGVTEMAVLVAEIFLALFAVFGLYAAVRLLATRIFSPRGAGFVLEFAEKPSEDELAAALCRAKDGFFMRGTWRLVVLLDVAMSEEHALIAALENEGCVVYLAPVKEKLTEGG